MSSYTQKQEYTCQCGKDYGTCEKTGKFFLRYEGVSDLFSLFWQPHPEEPVRHLLTMGDNDLHALGQLLTKKHEDLPDCNSEELNEIKAATP